jgi:ADP-heptose:LPS heptosyltransferase
MTSSVHVGSSYEEVRRIEIAAERASLFSLFLRGFLQGWLIASNAFLAILRGFLFRWGVPSPDDVQEIVIYTVGTLGDNVLMLPAIAGIRCRFPQARITSIVNCDGYSDYPAKEIIGRSAFVDSLLTLPGHPVCRSGWKITVDFPVFKKPPCELFVNLSPFGNRGWIGAVIREMIFARWLGAKWAVGFGMHTYARKGIFNRVQHRFVANEARRPREVLRQMGAAPVEDVDLLPKDAAAKEKVTRLVESLGGHSKRLVVLNPGSKLRASRWPAKRFGEVARNLAMEGDVLILVNGTCDEAQVCDEVVTTSGGASRSIAGELSIGELIELLRLADLCITNNTGPMTLSAMLGAPSVVIMSTRFSPTFYIPISDHMVSVFRFDENSYDYNDTGDAAEDLLGIMAQDVKTAVAILPARRRMAVNL